MFHSYTLKESAPVRSSSGASTVSEVFSGPLVQIFYNNQPPKLFFSTPTSIFKQNKQFFLSFHFSPHSSISVIALFPGIEKSCHSLSKSPWLKCPSGDHSNTLEVSSPRTVCEVVHTSIVSPRLFLSVLQLSTSSRFCQSIQKYFPTCLNNNTLIIQSGILAVAG